MCHSCRSLSRRELLKLAGMALATVAPVRTVRARGRGGNETVVLETIVVGAGTYAYLPFWVPAGVNRVHAVMETDVDASLGLGVFDQRGAHYQSPGFRGVLGAERAEFFVAADVASRSFLPGPIEPGTWTIVVPVFQAPRPTRVTVTVTLSRGPQRSVWPVRPVVGVVRDEPGWYRGDLHCHTPHSSDASASGSAMGPGEWARACRDLGLDFAAMTDHNVVSQNLSLAADTVPGVLLMAGEEVTNWFHGHATVSGLTDAAGWVDWRQRPLGVPLQRHEARITEMVTTATDLGAFVSAAHPLFAHLSWQFFHDGAADPAARTHGIEIWTGQFTPDCEAALDTWDALLTDGWRLVANGGSDLHGTDNDRGFVAGTPTTVVWADRLERGAVVEALRRGRCFVTRRPDGVEIYLTASGAGGQHQIVGGIIHGSSTDRVRVKVLVRRGINFVLTLIRDGAQVHAVPIASDEQTVSLDLPMGPGGYVRAEVRRAPTTDLAAPLSGHTGMEALTNPIFLAVGAPPDDHGVVHAPPPDTGGAQ